MYIELGIYVMVISILYSLRHGFKLIIELKKENPKPIKLNVAETILLYLAVTNIITGLILILL